MAENTSKKLKGQNLRVFVEDKVVAYATNCQINLQSNLEDASTKDSTGGWDQNEITGMSWNMTVDALHSVGTDNVAYNGESLTDLFLQGRKVMVKCSLTNGDQNRMIQEGSTYNYKGDAWIASLGVTAHNKQNCQLNVQFTGDGPLTKVNPLG